MSRLPWIAAALGCLLLVGAPHAAPDTFEWRDGWGSLDDGCRRYAEALTVGKPKEGLTRVSGCTTMIFEQVMAALDRGAGDEPIARCIAESERHERRLLACMDERGQCALNYWTFQSCAGASPETAAETESARNACSEELPADFNSFLWHTMDCLKELP